MLNICKIKKLYIFAPEIKLFLNLYKECTDTPQIILSI